VPIHAQRQGNTATYVDFAVAANNLQPESDLVIDWYNLFSIEIQSVYTVVYTQ